MNDSFKAKNELLTLSLVKNFQFQVFFLAPNANANDLLQVFLKSDKGKQSMYSSPCKDLLIDFPSKGSVSCLSK